MKSFDAPACVIVKHANPCGVGVGTTPVEAYVKAWTTDPTSAFGGIVAFNRPLDEASARRIGERKQFVEVLIAPAVTPKAPRCSPPRPTCACSRSRSTACRRRRDGVARGRNANDVKRVGSGL